MTVRLRGLQRMSLASAATSASRLVVTVTSPERAPSLGSPRRSAQSGPRPLIPSRLGSHATRLAATLLLFTTVAARALTATPAQARQARIFSGSFGGAASTTPALEADRLAEPWAVAVDWSTGDIYVADPGSHRVEKFSGSGAFILMFGKEVNESKVLAAAPEAEQNVCTAESLDTCQAGVAGSTPGAFEGPALFLAVDDSSGPSQGDVYVGGLVENALPGKNRVQKFDGSGGLVVGWGEAGQLDGSSVTTSPSAPLPGPFTRVHGVAVDASGNLWVYDGEVKVPGRVFEFRQDSSFAGNDWSSGESPGLGVAVDREGHVYLVSAAALTPRATVEFGATGDRVGVITAPGIKTEALAVDETSGDLYVGAQLESGFSVLRYAPGCEVGFLDGGCVPVESFASGHLFFSRGLAVGGSGAGGTIYAAETESGQVAGFGVEGVPDVITVKASGFTLGAAVLNGVVNPSGVELLAGAEGCRFEWGQTRAPYEHVVGCEETAVAIGSGSSPVNVQAEVTGLVPGRTYHFRLVAGNANNVNGALEVDEPSEGRDLSWGPPLVDSGSVSDVNSTGATLKAEVAPNSVDTRVRVEYGTDTSYGRVTPEVDIGSGETDQSVSSHVQGLAPETRYHYRIRAQSPLGVSEGEDHVFTTQRASGGVAVLPDAREWEMVSPPGGHGAIESIFGEVNFAIQAAAGGGAVSYLTTAASESQPAGNSNLSQVLSTRTRPGGGWQSRDIASPHSEAAGISLNFEEYRVFSEDLSLALLQPLGPFNPALSGEASEQTAYLRSDYLAGDVSRLCVESCYRPLVTGAPGFENVAPGSKFGIQQVHGDACPTEPQCGPEFRGASPSFDHIVLSSKAPLEEGGVENGLYEWSAGHLQLLSILPDDTPDGSGTAHLGQFNVHSLLVRHAVSADGSRVVWEDGSGSNLYLRDVTRGETVRLGSGLFQDASSDDSRVFFSHAGTLQECELVEEPGNLHCNLRNLGPLQGTVIGASEDGSLVYFAAGDELTVSRDGVVTPIVELSEEDAPDWDGNRSDEPLAHLTARVSPDGRWVAFMSDRSLTGYDNHDALSGKPDEEVFLYHAAAGEGEQGSLVCASCNPTGGRPRGFEFNELEPSGGRAGLAGGGSIWPSGQWLAANIPGWTSNFYQSRYLSDSGRLFFNSSDALAPQDTNATEDVYQYEPPGGEEAPTGDTCTAGSSTYSPDSGGCIDLISSGSSPGESAFLDASADGDEVFFLTAAELARQDRDKALDVYDAHACTTGSPCPPPPAAPQPACEGDACQTTVQPPADVTPGSLTFQGPGNLTTPLTIKPPVKPRPLTNAQKLAKALKACRKKHNKKRTVCEHTARKAFTARKAGRTAAPRGRGR